MCSDGCTSETGTDCANTFRKNAKINPAPGLSTGALIGVIVGALVGVALIGFVVYKFVLKKPAAATKGAPDDGVTAAA